MAVELARTAPLSCQREMDKAHRLGPAASARPRNSRAGHRKLRIRMRQRTFRHRQRDFARYGSVIGEQFRRHAE